MRPYESVYVGSFIYSLGFLACEAGFKLDGRCVTLLAQNPGDQRIGDLVADWGGRTFIIEFKRDQESLSSELCKPHKEKYLEYLASGHGENLRRQSERGHFVAYGVQGLKNRSELVFAPYWRLLELTTSPKPKGTNLDRFFTLMRDAQIGFSPAEYASYFQELLRRNPKPSSGGGLGRIAAEPEMSTLIFNYDEVSKRMSFVTVDLSRTMELERARDRGQERDLANERSLSRERDDHGFEI